MTSTAAIGIRLEAIDAWVSDALGAAPDSTAVQRLRDAATAAWKAAADPLPRAAWRAALARAADRVAAPADAETLRALARNLARQDADSGRPLACCDNTDMANLHAAISPCAAGAAISALLRSAIEHDLDTDANAILGPLAPEALAHVLDDLRAYAATADDEFKRFRAWMILFGVFHQDAPRDGGTVYIRTAAAPDVALARHHYTAAQQAYIEGIRRRLHEALAARGLASSSALAAYRPRIPAELRDRALTVRTGLRIELDSCVGNDHVLVSQDIGAQIIHVSILLRDAATGRHEFPISVRVRRLEEPVLRLASIDKGVPPTDVATIADVFRLDTAGANQWIRLTKASVIATGIVPYGCREEAPDVTLAAYLRKLGGGLEITTNVRGVPVGSGLGTSSAIAAAIVAALVKFTGQSRGAAAELDFEERMLVVARVLLVEQLIGALGGWQDPCAIFPGIKLLETRPRDFLPKWRPLRVPAAARGRLRAVLRLTDGAYRQPSEAAAWQFTGLWVLRLASVYEARMRSRQLVQEQIRDLEAGRIEALGARESADWINRTAISPKATNPYIEHVIAEMRRALGAERVGFDACGARGGAGGCWWVTPEDVPPDVFERAFAEVSARALERFQDTIRFEGAPRVYDYAINDVGLKLDLE